MSAVASCLSGLYHLTGRYQVYSRHSGSVESDTVCMVESELSHLVICQALFSHGIYQYAQIVGINVRCYSMSQIEYVARTVAIASQYFCRPCLVVLMLLARCGG